MQPDAAALNTCCLSAMAATNGHHRRWAVQRCLTALSAPGVLPASPATDERAARAMLAVADGINKHAAEWVARDSQEADRVSTRADGLSLPAGVLPAGLFFTR